MKKILLLVGFVIFTNTVTKAQCTTETSEEKVLLIGDSWAYFMHFDKTFNNVFAKWGHSNYKYYSNSTLAVNGAETDDFLLPAKQNEIQTQLTNKPSIKLVHISLAGNDFLGSWNTGYTPARLDSLQDTVNTRLLSIINFVKGIRPDIHVIISGYVYSNFEEVITTSAFPTSHPFYNRWQAMGAPSNLVLNNLLNRFSDTLELRVANDPRITFVKATSLMQYAFGQITPLGVAPSGTYAAKTAPLPKGFTNYPSPKITMRNYGLFNDCFHLSIDGYKQFINYQTQKFYHKALMDDYFVRSEGGNKDGSISSTGVASISLLLAGNAGVVNTTALSFNTITMKDTSIARASIFLRRSALTGSNTVTASTLVEVKIKKGKFGSLPDVEATDITAPASATQTVCIYGSYTNNEDWLRIDLSPTLIAQLSNDTITQFLITITNSNGGLIEYSNASNPEFAPVLNVKYGIPSTVGLTDLSKSDLEFNVFPNPVNDFVELHFSANEKREISIVNLLGNQLHAETTTVNNVIVNTDALASGIYFITVKTANGKTSTKKIIKN